MSGRLQILWLASWYPNRNDPFDGDFIQRHARAAARFHDIHVIWVGEAPAGSDGYREEETAEGLTEERVYFRAPAGPLSRLQRYLAWRRRYRRAAADYFARKGRPQLVHVHVPWKAGLVARWIKSKFGLPYLVSEHWGIYDRTTTGFRPPHRMREGIRKVLQDSEALVAVSHYLGGGLLELAPEKPLHLLPNVVDTSLFHPDAKAEVFTFVHVSNMVPLKNVAGILAAFRRFLEGREHLPVRLLLIGNRDGAYPELAENMGFPTGTVQFLGELPYEEVGAVVRRCHCLVLFSERETFSCVTAEALCAGLAVVANNTGALPELVDAASGILVPPGDVDALVVAMEAAFRAPGTYATPGFAGKAAARFGPDAVGRQFDLLYRRYGGPAGTQQGLNKK